MPTLVVGDCHGDYRNLLRLLVEAGAVRPAGVRAPGWRVIQLGDLCHFGSGLDPRAAHADDHAALGMGIALCDELLVGNHELPYLYPEAGFPGFARMGRPHGRTLALLHQARDKGLYRAATAVDGWLVTHAGLHSHYAKRSGYPDAMPAHAVAARINARFAERVAGHNRAPVEDDEIFDAVGRERGGRHVLGGIMWCDWSRLTSSLGQRKQIVGHTPQRDAPARFGQHLWCADVGAALSGQVCALRKGDGPGDDWEPLTLANGVLMGEG